MTTNKRYRLLKDFSDLPSGVIFTEDLFDGEIIYRYTYKGKSGYHKEWFVKETGYFEEIIETPTPKERIPEWMPDFCTQMVKDAFPAEIRKAEEAAFNAGQKLAQYPDFANFKYKSFQDYKQSQSPSLTEYKPKVVDGGSYRTYMDGYMAGITFCQRYGVPETTNP